MFPLNNLACKELNHKSLSSNVIQDEHIDV